MGHENVFHDIFERKTSFKDYKISKLEKSKTGFGQKLTIFHFVILREIRKKYFFFTIF